MNNAQAYLKSNFLKFLLATIAFLLIIGIVAYFTFTPKYEFDSFENGYAIILCNSRSETITFPDKHQGKPVVKIGSLVFGFYNSVRILQIPDSVTLINHSAFYGVDSLEECYAGTGVREIGEAAFCDCVNLSRLELPDSVTFIDKTAFKGCEKLTIYCPADSYAEQFARENGIPFVAT